MVFADPIRAMVMHHRQRPWQAPMLRVVVLPPEQGSVTMIVALQCKIYATDCQQLGLAGDISMQRATILMAMSRSWTTLANQVLRYDTIVKEEDK
jgi:hypothetical protein